MIKYYTFYLNSVNEIIDNSETEGTSTQVEFKSYPLILV